MSDAELLQALQSETPEPVENGFLVRERNGCVSIPADEIRLIEARGNYALLYTARGKFMIRETMCALESRLEAVGFLRVHRSAIVNLAVVKAVVPRRSGDRVVVLRDGTRLRVGRLYSARLLQRTG
jgi:two-component system LytT family response regulator